jgi:hypothetical protein
MIVSDPNNQPPTAQKARGDASGANSDDMVDWLARAQDAYRSSTSYVDSNYRKTWDDGLAAFNSQHAGDSKFNHPSYEKRSRLYRPKTRSIIRKNEAAAASAFFSNMDTTSINAEDQSDKMQVAAADVMQHLLQYRLTKSIPWYQIVLGGLQDAQSMGAVAAHVYWDYKPAVEEEVLVVAPIAMAEVETEYPQQDALPENAVVAMEVGDTPPLSEGQLPPPMKPPAQPQQPPAMSVPQMPQPKPKPNALGKDKPLSDKPVVDLIPLENLRVDASANWTDPINSSPFVIHLMPMYVMDVKEKMESGEWFAYDDGEISNATTAPSDSTRSSRQKGREDPYTTSNKGVSDYEICWVQRHIHRKGGVDYEFYTLADQAMLTEPRPLKETVFHGKRPYVMGCCVLETHKIYPSSIASLGKGLQDEANEVVNQRIDNVKFVLNKKFLVKRGREADIAGLVRNVPGGVVMLDDPMNDVKELSWPDVTGSAYEEQSRIDQDMNDLLGNFSPAQVMADHGIQGPARNMQMLSQSSSTLVEYLLRTYVETFVQPVLRQLVLLEQEYETDQVILSLAGKKSKAMQKFGMDEVTDELLEQELTLTVNVGMNATDPQMKLQKFMAAMNGYVAMLEKRVPGVDMAEVGKEIFGHLGYSDGTRFFTTEDPQKLQLQQQLQQAMQMIQKLESQVKEKVTGHQAKIQAAKMLKDSKIETAMIKEDGLNRRNVVTHLRALRDADRAHVHEVNMSTLKHRQQSSMSSGAEGSGRQQPMSDGGSE